jgi:hypothetical protein
MRAQKTSAYTVFKVRRRQCRSKGLPDLLGRVGGADASRWMFAPPAGPPDDDEVAG